MHRSPRISRLINNGELGERGTDSSKRRPEVVTRWAARGAERRQSDNSFAEDYEKLDRMLAGQKTEE